MVFLNSIIAPVYLSQLPILLNHSCVQFLLQLISYSLLETVYLFGSYENASRLLSALKRAKAQTNQPQTLEDLRRELGIEEASEKISA